MIKYLKLIPIIIYPYAYLIYFMLIASASDVLDRMSEDTSSLLMFGVLVLYNIYVFVFSICNSVVTACGKYTAYEAAKMNLIVKGFQIPAYLFHFILGLAGFFMGIFGLGFLFFAIAIDLVSIVLSGINSIGCSVKMKKDGVLSKTQAVLAGIGCFVYCVDVFIAILYFIIARKKCHSGI